MNLYLTRESAINREIRDALAVGLEDLLDDGGTIDDYYYVDEIADKVLETVVRPNGIVCYCMAPDICPSLFRDIAEEHTRPVSE